VSAGAIDRALYFAYGSNLLSSRLRERIPSADVFRTARLDDHRLSFGKLGRDGSGKATLVAELGAHVWGVVYAIDRAHWRLLDRFEPGYARTTVDVTAVSRERLSAATYVAPVAKPHPVASADYVGLVVAGAREHALPGYYIDGLARLLEGTAFSD
jgi:gamma-glutamylcyclotransferase (GGCT)/AIG2-like uncharacterized protein YtfP